MSLHEAGNYATLVFRRFETSIIGREVADSTRSNGVLSNGL